MCGGAGSAPLDHCSTRQARPVAVEACCSFQLAAMLMQPEWSIVAALMLRVAG